MRSAKFVAKGPDSVRASAPVDPKSIDRMHGVLAGIQVSLPTENGSAGARDTRAVFVEIRTLRNRVSRVASAIMPKLAALRADVIRVEKVIAAEEAAAIDTGHAKGRNTDERRAALREMLREWHEARAELKAEVALLEEVMDHAKWKRDELRSAFEEASRGLAVIELEYRIERGES